MTVYKIYMDISLVTRITRTYQMCLGLIAFISKMTNDKASTTWNYI